MAAAAEPAAYTEKQRYMDAMPGVMSICLIVFGGVFSCSAIPTLAAFCIVNGALQFLNTVFKFAFRIPMDPKLQNKADKPTQLSGLVGLLSIFVAVWGAVITIPKAGDAFTNKLENCDTTLFYTGFISSIIPLAFVVCFAVYSIVAMTCLKKPDNVSAVEEA